MILSNAAISAAAVEVCTGIGGSSSLYHPNVYIIHKNGEHTASPSSFTGQHTIEQHTLLGSE